MTTLNLETVSEMDQSVMNMDVLLRCPICKNYFENPVLLSGCSHNFCSDCIRRSLLHKNECPICRNSSLRSHLISNKIIKQLSDAYRMQKKNHCKRSPSKKRKASALNDIDTSALEPPKNRRKLTHPNNNKKRNDTVHCPVCAKAIVKSFINSHMDECLLKPKIVETLHNDQKERCDHDEDIDIAMVRTKENCSVKVLPFLAYTHMKERELRKIVNRLHLNSNGNKKLLVKRHREFVLRHNSQIDAYLNGNDIRNDRNIARQINNEEGKVIHSNFFAPNRNKKGKRKNERDKLYKKLIKDLKIRMG
eukprot:187075_1